MFREAPPLWQDGPAPGLFYNFPNTNVNQVQNSNADAFKHIHDPVTTATSIVAFVYDKGVIIAGDLLASYGSLARYRNCPRVTKVNDNIIMGAGGDYADYQYLKQLIDQKIIDEDCLDDGVKLKPKSLYCWLTRIMYNRRSKFDPLWNNLVVGGLQDGVPFLATVDKLGTAYEDHVICTGYGAHIVTPLIRAALDQNPYIKKTEAKAMILKAMEILFYRDARSYPKFQIATLDEIDGVQVEGPIEVAQNWHMANLIH